MCNFAWSYSDHKVTWMLCQFPTSLECRNDFKFLSFFPFWCGSKLFVHTQRSLTTVVVLNLNHQFWTVKLASACSLIGKQLFLNFNEHNMKEFSIRGFSLCYTISIESTYTTALFSMNVNTEVNIWNSLEMMVWWFGIKFQFTQTFSLIANGVFRIFKLFEVRSKVLSIHAMMNLFMLIYLLDTNSCFRRNVASGAKLICNSWVYSSRSFEGINSYSWNREALDLHKQKFYVSSLSCEDNNF